MTKLLEQAIEEVKKLPEDEQDALAERLLVALDEQRWDELFAQPESEKFLEELANEIREDIKAGRAEPLDPDKM